MDPAAVAHLLPLVRAVPAAMVVQEDRDTSLGKLTCIATGRGTYQVPLLLLYGKPIPNCPVCHLFHRKSMSAMQHGGKVMRIWDEGEFK